MPEALPQFVADVLTACKSGRKRPPRLARAFDGELQLALGRRRRSIGRSAIGSEGKD